VLSYNQEIVGLGIANFAGDKASVACLVLALVLSFQARRPFMPVSMYSCHTVCLSPCTTDMHTEVRGMSPTNGPCLHNCDVAGAMFSSYTTTGSFSRSAINNNSGAKTQLAGFITSMVVMFVLCMTTVFALLPYNTMAAIIIAGVEPHWWSLTRLCICSR